MIKNLEREGLLALKLVARLSMNNDRLAALLAIGLYKICITLMLQLLLLLRVWHVMQMTMTTMLMLMLEFVV